MPNRLASETSPYLLQHANNPVDWYPWGDEAFEKARSDNKPVFLSVGYSSCHWCHVMEHESFEDAEVARILNERFVSVKVDREERPDVDTAYMTAVQLTTGRGGWPMSLFLTPDRKPFFAGTYIPKEDRGKAAGFLSVLAQIAQLWQMRRSEILTSADQYAQALTETIAARVPGTFDKLDQKAIDDAVRVLAGQFDAENGGFGEAPKFPPHSAIEFLLAYAVHPNAPEDLRGAALGMACRTLQTMAMGGIHDQVGGGFHRYSTDERWLLPHFEKMLYDNALLLGNYARAAGLVHGVEPELAGQFVGVLRGIVGWVAREMTSPEGLFYSALDADSEGEEGKYYVWSLEEIRNLVPDPNRFAEAYGMTAEGNYQDEASGQRTGSNVLYLSEESAEAFEPALDRLLEARLARVAPGLDDKALVGWNGLMIAGLAEAGAPTMAENAALAILDAERDLGRLPHQIAKGVASGDAYLEDYAYFADGLVRLGAFVDYMESAGQRPGDLRQPAAFWIRQAQRLAQEMVASFYDEANGGFFATGERHEELFGRSKPVFDSPTPSGNAVAIRVLTALGDHERAQKSLDSLLGWMRRAPQATEALHLAAMPYVEATPAEAPVAVAPVGEVSATFSPREKPAGSDGKAEFLLAISVPEGLHINSSQPPARWLTPTRVEVRPLRAEVRYPEAVEDRYVGEVRIPIVVQLPSGSSGEEFEVNVSYQACTESECLAPVEKRFSGVVVRG